ncbi:sigma-70 family RNA polymerase sigma factor [Arthrobacter sp. PAMC25564]|uniref:RNA polymerase sigma factor n=1 Tax=Arthrobacter sp. PAMC25564 TaxID=2565366 RepID=UPI0010A29A04|nr:sigma-70 family RNA polymerase sigma factor [Arthrobacter sp. PAMC25564]QCB95671.1 sigma-70 family RNA polymerase sigma factor [Arthrobacter sp. PAMC25564]
MAEQLSDDELSAALAGEPSGFSAVYTAVSPAVLGYFRARGVEDAEALTQDVFVDVLPKLAKVTGGHSGLRTFIFSVAHARLVDYRRRAARTPYLAEYDPRDDARYAKSAEDEALGSLGGMSGTLSRLNEEQREVLVLRIVADLSIEQVAGIMDKTPGAVKQLQRRGLSALRELVTEKDHAAS